MGDDGDSTSRGAPGGVAGRSGVDTPAAAAGSTPGRATPDPRQELGRRGEQLAADYLTGIGLLILDRNWRCREGELDLVATDGLGRVHFCEVKTRSGDGYGTPAEAVTRGKRRRIRRLATLWLQSHRVGWRPTQFDVISVLWPRDGAPALTYLPEAF